MASFLTLIVPLSIFPGKWHTGFSTLLSVCPLSVVMFLCIAFVLLPANLFGIRVFDCPLAVSVLSWLQSLLFYSSPLSPTVLVRHVLFGFSSDELRVVPRVFVYLVNVCNFCNWWARNDYRFCSVPSSLLIVMDRAKAPLRPHFPLFFRRFSSGCRRRFFVRQWGARGVVQSLMKRMGTV